MHQNMYQTMIHIVICISSKAFIAVGLAGSHYKGYTITVYG